MPAPRFVLIFASTALALAPPAAAAAPAGGARAAGNPNCGNAGVDYGPWLGPVGGRGHRRMIVRLDLSEQNQTCRIVAHVVVNCPPADRQAPEAIIGTGYAKLRRHARHFRIRHSGTYPIKIRGGGLYQGTPVRARGRFVGSMRSGGYFVGPRAVKVTLRASKCDSPGPFRFRMRRRD